MIPKMEYVILTSYECPLKVRGNSILSALKQENCFGVRIVIPKKDESVLAARIRGFKSVTTEYFVSMDDDVTLKDGWIEEMWPYMKDDTIIGGIVATSLREVKYRKTIIKPLFRELLGKLQNTILKKEWFDVIKHPKEIGIDDHMFINIKMLEKGKKWFLVPVISVHTAGYKPAAFREGIRAGARRRRLGILNNWIQVVKTAVGHIISGIKIGIRLKDPYFMTYFAKMGLGYIIGFGKWNIYSVKYDYSARW